MADRSSAVTVLPGIGPARAAAFARLGLHTLGDLLTHYPRGYENRGSITTLSAAPADTKCALMLTIATVPTVHMIRRGMVLLKLRAFDESGTAELTFFNQSYLKSLFSPDQTWRVWGKVERTGGRYSISSPVCEPTDGDAPLPGLIPVWPLTEGISQKQMAAAVWGALEIARRTLTIRFLLIFAQPTSSVPAPLPCGRSTRPPPCPTLPLPDAASSSTNFSPLRWACRSTMRVSAHTPRPLVPTQILRRCWNSSPMR